MWRRIWWRWRRCDRKRRKKKFLGRWAHQAFFNVERSLVGFHATKLIKKVEKFMSNNSWCRKKFGRHFFWNHRTRTWGRTKRKNERKKGKTKKEAKEEEEEEEEEEGIGRARARRGKRGFAKHFGEKNPTRVLSALRVPL